MSFLSKKERLLGTPASFGGRPRKDMLACLFYLKSFTTGWGNVVVGNEPVITMTTGCSDRIGHKKTPDISVGGSWSVG